MIFRSIRATWHHFKYLPLLSAITFSRGRSFARRSQALGVSIGWVLRWYPPARRWFEREFLKIFPDMPRAQWLDICQRMGVHMGRTLFEIYHSTEFQAASHKFHVSGEGLQTLEKAFAAGKGAIVVSGHFGQWEAVRAVLKKRGIETGAVYRRQANRHYQRRLLAGIQATGNPIVSTGRAGTRALVRHLKAGRVIAIMLDEKHPNGARLPFLGRDALTSLSAANLAIKYGIPMIPAFGTRIADGNEFDVEFEAEIPHSDSITMTQAFNDSLSKRILENPDQWYWLLRRWDGA